MFKRCPLLLISAIGVLLAPMQVAAETKPWREAYYNPKPADDDLILPMPCGGAMAFRPVTTLHLDDGIADTSILLGGDSDKLGFVNGRRDVHLSGSFTGKDPVSIKTPDGKTHKILPRLFYIAKYEISAPQFQVVMEGCPEKRLRKKAFVPKVRATWFDAVAFGEAYSVWLSREVGADLREQFGVMPFVRLPTEAEWEFAARGGDVVTPAEFSDPHYPLNDKPLVEYESFRNSTAGKVQPIGAFLPNPLGIHDILGNVSELTLEPFRLVRQGRVHGRAGGFVARGGNANSAESQMSAATRQEVRFYHPETGEIVADERMGFRVVLATLAIETDADKERFAKATAAAASPDVGTASGIAEANALAELEQVARITDQDERLSRLTEIARILDTARTERNDQRNRAIEAVLIAAATSCNTAFQQLRNLNFYRRKLTEAKEVMDEIYAIRDAGDITQEELDQIPSLERAYERILNNVTRTEARVRTHIGSYAEFIDTLRRDYSSSVTDPILPLTRARMDGSGLSVMSACLGIAASHLEIARIDGRLDVDQWQTDFEKIIKN